jgi:hypothetical protein
MKRDVEKSLKSALSKKHCYVLITCDPPSDDGNMQVEMTYEGDAALAAYLLQGAQEFIDGQESCSKQFCESKIYYLE